MLREADHEAPNSDLRAHIEELRDHAFDEMALGENASP
jgi:hypothetical protein